MFVDCIYVAVLYISVFFLSFLSSCFPSLYLMLHFWSSSNLRYCICWQRKKAWGRVTQAWFLESLRMHCVNLFNGMRGEIRKALSRWLSQELLFPGLEDHWKGWPLHFSCCWACMHDRLWLMHFTDLFDFCCCCCLT